GLVMPVLSTCYLEITTPRYRSSIIGVKESVSGLGGIAGPLLVVLANRWLTPQNTFAIGGSIIAGTGFLALFLLRSYRLHMASVTASTGEICSDEPLVDLPEVALTGNDYVYTGPQNR